MSRRRAAWRAVSCCACGLRYLTPGRPYRFRVAAETVVGTGPYTAVFQQAWSLVQGHSERNDGHSPPWNASEHASCKFLQVRQFHAETLRAGCGRCVGESTNSAGRCLSARSNSVGSRGRAFTDDKSSSARSAKVPRWRQSTDTRTGTRVAWVWMS